MLFQGRTIVITFLIIFSNSMALSVLNAHENFSQTNSTLEEVVEMTPQETLQAFLTNLFNGDMDKALALVSKDAQFISTNPRKNEHNTMHGTFLGHQGAREFFGAFFEVLEPGDFETTDGFGDNKHAAMYGHLAHKVRSTGKVFESDWALIAKVVDGKISLYHFYEDTEALYKALN